MKTQFDDVQVGDLLSIRDIPTRVCTVGTVIEMGSTHLSLDCNGSLFHWAYRSIDGDTKVCEFKNFKYVINDMRLT